MLTPKYSNGYPCHGPTLAEDEFPVQLSLQRMSKKVSKRKRHRESDRERERNRKREREWKHMHTYVH